MKPKRWMLVFLCLVSVDLYAQHKSDAVPPSSFTVKAVNVSTYTPVFIGVSQAKLTVPGKDASVGYVLRVDLEAPGISFAATSHAGTKETISETSEDFAREEHLQAAINAGFFSPCCSAKPEGKSIRGLMISGGKVIAPISADTKYRYSLLIAKDNHATIELVAQKTNLSKVFTAVTGSAEIVRDGKNTGDANLLNDAAHANPRTLVGLSRNGRYLYMVAIDGRKPGYSIGTTNTESATILLALHVWTGLNLDGGGSTSMVLETKSGEVVSVNHPSGGTERLVAASLGLHALRLGTAQK